MLNTRIAFFGTPNFSVIILDELKTAGVIPTVIITAPDKPQGRGLILTPSEVKVWALQNNIPVLEPIKLDADFIEKISPYNCDLFIVVAYGKIIPESVLNLPKYKTLNVHPSLLPKLRGPSPIESAIMQDLRETGTTIMRLDAEMDHGPIMAQEKIMPDHWPLPAPELEKILAETSGKLLAKTIPNWIEGKITETEQKHNEATYTRKISKADGLIDLTDEPYRNFLKTCANAGWPGTYFIVKHSGKDIQVKITQASYEDKAFVIKKVVPEGKKEMMYEDFLRGLKV